MARPPANQLQNNPGPLLNADFFSVPYVDGNAENEYDFDPGVLAVPISAPFLAGRPTIEVIQLYGPVEYRTVRWTTTRWGAKPKVPSPAAKPNEVLIRATMRPMAPKMDNFRAMYTISGTFVYALFQPALISPAGLSMPKLPFSSASTQESYNGADIDSSLT